MAFDLEGKCVDCRVSDTAGHGGTFLPSGHQIRAQRQTLKPTQQEVSLSFSLYLSLVPMKANQLPIIPLPEKWYFQKVISRWTVK